jgi:DNA-binding PadR family transcriptional regulator
LVALAEGGTIGSELQSRIVADTVGVYVGVSSLYAALHRLEDVGLIDSHDGVYALTDKGWHKLTHETRVLESLVQHAKRRVVATGHGRW